MEKDSRRVSARVGDYADPDALNSKTRRDAEVRHNISVKSEINDDAKLVDTWPTLGFLPSSQLTRADLAKVLEGVFEPQERVDGEIYAHLELQSLMSS